MGRRTINWDGNTTYVCVGLYKTRGGQWAVGGACTTRQQHKYNTNSTNKHIQNQIQLKEKYEIIKLNLQLKTSLN